SAISCTVIFEVWAQINGTPRQDRKDDYKNLASAFGNGWLYGLIGLVGLLLFIIPGLYVLISASLGIVMVCIEKRRAMNALEQSRQLVKGYFWTPVRYLLPAPLLAIIGVIGGGVVLNVIGANVDAHFDNSFGSIFLTFCVSL